MPRNSARYAFNWKVCFKFALQLDGNPAIDHMPFTLSATAMSCKPGERNQIWTCSCCNPSCILGTRAKWNQEINIMFMWTHSSGYRHKHSVCSSCRDKSLRSSDTFKLGDFSCSVVWNSFMGRNWAQRLMCFSYLAQCKCLEFTSAWKAEIEFVQF